MLSCLTDLQYLTELNYKLKLKFIKTFIPVIVHALPNQTAVTISKQNRNRKQYFDSNIA